MTSSSSGRWGIKRVQGELRLKEPVSERRSGQLCVLSPPARSVESERPVLGTWSQYLGLRTWEQLFNLSQRHFPLLSRGDVHAYFRSRWFPPGPVPAFHCGSLSYGNHSQTTVFQILPWTIKDRLLPIRKGICSPSRTERENMTSKHLLQSPSSPLQLRPSSSVKWRQFLGSK